MEPTNGIVPEYEARIQDFQDELQAYRDACGGMKSSTLALWVQDIASDFDTLRPYSNKRERKVVDGVVANIKHLEAENERLQKQLQEARAACDLYENELIALRMKVDDMMLEDFEPRFIFERLAGNWSGYGVIWDTVLSGYFVSENTRCNMRYDAHKFMVEDGLNATDNLNDMEKYNMRVADGVTPDEVKQALDEKLNIASDEDTQEVDVEPVQSCQYCGQVLLSPLFEFGVNGLFCSSDCVQHERDHREIAQRDFEREIYKRLDNEDDS